MKLGEAERIVEALIFAAVQPISVAELCQLTHIDEPLITGIIGRIRNRHQDGGICLRKAGGKYQFVTIPEVASWVEKLDRPVIRTPLSPASLETLAIIAYEQPITKADIEEIRGVNSDSAIRSLIERDLISDQGRKDAPGRPILYGTTDKFLTHFDLDSLGSLPETKVLQKQQV